MGDVYWGIHTPLAALVARAGIRIAVETGTYYGLGTLQLASLFERVITIEADDNLYAFCSDLYGRKGITFLHGPSGRELAKVAAEINQAVFYFLDAHWFPSPALAATASHQCPILEELKSLQDANVLAKGSVIVIDDADMFLGSLPPGLFRIKDFPSLAHIMFLLKEKMGAEFVEIIDDVVLAGPAWLEQIVSKYRVYKDRFGAPGARRLAI